MTRRRRPAWRSSGRRRRRLRLRSTLPAGRNRVSLGTDRHAVERYNAFGGSHTIADHVTVVGGREEPALAQTPPPNTGQLSLDAWSRLKQHRQRESGAADSGGADGRRA